MKKTYRKNIMRTVKQTSSRFVAILAIVALGVGFLSGLLATTPDMRYAGDRFFDESNLYDIRVLGSMGVTQSDVAMLRDLQGVEQVAAGYTADVLMTLPESEEVVARLHSVDMDTLAQENNINQVVLLEGRYPQADNEVLLVQGNEEVQQNAYHTTLGDTVQVSTANKNTEDALAITKFTVVGLVSSSAYFARESEASNIGSGSVDIIVYVPKAAFAYTVYTDVYLTLAQAKTYNSMQQAYEDFVDAAVAPIETLGKARSPIRYAQVQQEAQVALDDARQTYETSKAQAETALGDAQKELDDSAKTIAEASAELAEKQREVDQGKSTLTTKRAQAQTQFAAAQQTLDNTKTTLAQSVKEYESGVAQLAQAKTALTSLADASKAAQVAVDTATKAQAQAQVQLEQASTASTVAQATYDAGVTGYGSQAAWLAAKPVDANAAIQALETARRNLAVAQEAVSQATQGVTTAHNAAATCAAQYTQTSTQITQTESQLADAKQKITAGQAQLSIGEQNLVKEQASANAQMEQAQSELDSAQAKIDAGKADLAQAQHKWEEGQAKYQTEKADADDKLDDAFTKLNHAQKEIDTLKEPQWYVQTRLENSAVSSFIADTQKVEAVAGVFPIFFFVVAALVSLTTMTRMIEEERLQIGTLKALGYRKGTIMAKYMLYALAASLLGSIIGVWIGMYLFPVIIWNTYSSLYILPPLYCKFWPQITITASAIAIACTLLATLHACWDTLREKPAQLLQAKAPKAGKRIVLERIPFLWKRLKFTHKVTARNLLRYKKRFFMTTIGIGGCTALLVAGFGLQDSFRDIVSKQFGQVYSYHAIVSYDNTASNTDQQALQAVLEDKSLVDKSLPVQQESVTVSQKDKTYTAYMTVPQTSVALNDFVHFQNRTTGEKYTFGEDDVFINEKLHELTGVNVGDTIAVTDVDGKQANLVVTQIFENYVENYIYVAPAVYEKAFGQSAQSALLLLQAADDTAQGQSALGEKLLAQDAVNGLRFVSSMTNSFTNMLSKINIIVLVLIISAGALAFVVLYNLTNINIAERIKELATIKVLGFTQREVKDYVFREVMLLSLIGAIFGLVFGYFLHQFVVLSVEVDIVMFGRTVQARSYVFAVVLTMVFSVLVDWFMRKKLRRISMVESMKSSE